MTLRPIWVAVAGLLAIASPALACEPILPLAQLLAGGTLAGPAMLTSSALCLCLAVALKCVAFVFLERRLTWRRAIAVMLLANVVSTIPGILVAVLVSSATGFGFVLFVPIILTLGWLLERRLALLPHGIARARLCGGLVTLAFGGLFTLSVLLFVVASAALNADRFVTYWLIKLLFVTAAAGTGIVLSAVMEEGLVAWLQRKIHAGQSFFPSVFRPNYITLGAVLLVAAIRILPTRLHSPHFMTSWLQSVLAAIS